MIIPGVVSHATNVVEHPDLVADRIVRFADLVGRENVVASTDCGLGGRVIRRLLLPSWRPSAKRHAAPPSDSGSDSGLPGLGASAAFRGA